MTSSNQSSKANQMSVQSKIRKLYVLPSLKQLIQRPVWMTYHVAIVEPLTAVPQHRHDGSQTWGLKSQCGQLFLQLTFVVSTSKVQKGIHILINSTPSTYLVHHKSGLLMYKFTFIENDLIVCLMFPPKLNNKLVERRILYVQFVTK